MTVSMDALYPKNLFMSQPVQTGSRPATYQKDDGHIPSNLALNEQLGRSIRTYSSHPDPATATNMHLNDIAFRYINELNAASSAAPALDSLRRMPSVNDTVTQVLSQYEQGNTQELLQGKPVSKRSGHYNNTLVI